MANPYAFRAVDENDVERLAGELTFTDPGNQPGATPTLAAVLAVGNDANALQVRNVADGTLAQDAATVAQLPPTPDLGAVLAAGHDAAGGQITGLSGGLDVGAGTITGADAPGNFTLDADFGVSANPKTGFTCFQAGNAHATVALDAAGLGIVNFATLGPVAPPAITGALSTVIDAAAKDVLTSLIAALVGLGLATDGTT